MSKLKCEERSCKHNCHLACNKQSIVLDDDAICCSYQKVNEALLKAEKTEDEAAMLRRNINVFKRRLRGLIEEQLTMVDEIDKVEF